jgi:hypothetical protein
MVEYLRAEMNRAVAVIRKLLFPLHDEGEIAAVAPMSVSL